MDEEEEGELYGHETEFSSSTQHSYLQERCVVVCVFLTKSPYRLLYIGMICKSIMETVVLQKDLSLWLLLLNILSFIVLNATLWLCF